MKKNISVIIAAAMLCIAGRTTAWGQIVGFPCNYDFENEAIAPFDDGDIVDATDWGKALRVSNKTATAVFDSDGSGTPYYIPEDQEVTIQFHALQGWQGNNSTATIQLVNSDGVVLVGYTYNQNATKVTDVVVGGQTATGFEPFMGQANCDTNNKSANGFTHKQHYTTTEGYTPLVTMKVHGMGPVSFNMSYTSNSGAIDKTYTANLTDVKMDLAKLVIIDNCTNEDRSIGIDDLTFTAETKLLFNYVIKYVDSTNGNNVVKTIEGAAEPGTIIAISDEVVWADGVKYYILSDDAADNAVADDNNTVITVVCKPAPLYAYKVTAMTGETELGTLADDKYYEGETVGYSYPRYFNLGGTLYKKDPIDQVYQGKLTLDEDNKAVTVEYDATNITNVVCYVEAEDIAGLAVCNTSTVADRCSMRAGAYATEQSALVKLTPGTYTLKAAAYGGAYTFWAGTDNEVLAIASAGSWRETTSEAFTLEQPTTLTFQGGTGTAGSLDYIILQSEDGQATEVATAISGAVLKRQTGEKVVYNMNGQRVVTPAKGVYVIDGRKVIMK